MVEMREVLSRFARHLDRENDMIHVSVHAFCFQLETFFMLKDLYFSSYMWNSGKMLDN